MTTLFNKIKEVTELKALRALRHLYVTTFVKLSHRS